MLCCCCHESLNVLSLEMNEILNGNSRVEDQQLDMKLYEILYDKSKAKI